MKHLNQKIVTYLSKKTGLSPLTIKKNISLLRRRHSSCTSNAVAHIYAQSINLSVLQKLDKEDKASLPHFELETKKLIIKTKKLRTKPKIMQLIRYDTNDPFIKGHINEINMAYTCSCYTCANILARKIIENLIIDILRAKYPQKTKAHTELYYNTSQRRYKDFGIILDSLYKKRTEFDLDDKKLVERLISKARALKEDANDKTHSWFYLVKSKKEIDELEIQTIIDLIIRLESNLGIRIT